MVLQQTFLCSKSWCFGLLASLCVRSRNLHLVTIIPSLITPRPLFLFPWFRMTNSFLLSYGDYVPFPLQRSSSVKAKVKLRGRVAQITANKWYSRPIIQTSLFICDVIFMCLFTNVIQSNRPGEQLKTKFSSHFSSISKEAFPILLRIGFGAQIR